MSFGIGKYIAVDIDVVVDDPREFFGVL